MNKFILIVSLIFLLNISSFSQTKSVADAESEIKTFQNFSNFSVKYNDPKDLTSAKVNFDIIGNNKTLKKKFKKFEWELTSIYSGIGIDDKPVRNTLCINTRSKRLHFARNNVLTILLGSEEINFDIPNRTSKVKGRKVYENLCWDVTKQIIKDFANATSINFQIGSVKSSFSSDKLQLFKNYNKLLHSPNK